MVREQRTPVNSQVCKCTHHKSSHGLRDHQGCSRCWCDQFRQPEVEIQGDARPEITK